MGQTEAVEKPLEPLQRPPSLHRSVQDAIKDYILRNRLRADDPLPSEGELARSLGVGRNSVREAVRSLESVGVLETRRGSGLYLKSFSFEPLLENLPYGLMFDLRELEELLELRRVLEVGLIEPAIAAMTPERMAELTAAVEGMRVHASAGERFLEEDRAFHQLLYKNLGNRLLEKLLDTFWLAFRKAVAFSDLGAEEPLSTYRDHAVILEAVAARDTPAARDALDRHYAGIQRQLERARAGPG